MSGDYEDHIKELQREKNALLREIDGLREEERKVSARISALDRERKSSLVFRDFLTFAVGSRKKAGSHAQHESVKDS